MGNRHVHPTMGDILAEFNRRVDADFARATGPRENPAHPIFRNHNCAKCASGLRPCKQGTPNQCEFPHARND